MSYFKKHWSTKLQGDVTKCAEEVVSKTFSHHYFYMLICVLVQGTVSATESGFGSSGICDVKKEKTGDSHLTS